MLFGPKSALQKGPFLLKIEVSPLKNACFANFKRKIFCRSTESYIFRELSFFTGLFVGSVLARHASLGLVLDAK